MRWRLNRGLILLDQAETLHGFGNIIPEGDGFGYAELYISPQARRSLKMAWRAARRLQAEAQEIGMRALGVGVVEPAARRLALAFGFEDTGRDHVPGARIMVRRLADDLPAMSLSQLAWACFPGGLSKHPEVVAAYEWAWQQMPAPLADRLRRLLPPGSGFTTGAPWLGRAALFGVDVATLRRVLRTC